MTQVSLLSKADQSSAIHSSSVLSVTSAVNSSNLLPLAIQVGTEFALQLSQRNLTQDRVTTQKYHYDLDQC